MTHARAIPETGIWKYTINTAIVLLAAATLTLASTSQSMAGAPSLPPPLPPTLTETIEPFGLEFTLHNPDPSSVGRAFGMALHIINQELIADTTNGWDYATLFAPDEWDDQMISGTSNTVFDLTWAQFFQGSFNDIFGAGSFVVEQDVILAYFVDYSAPASTPVFAPADDMLLVDPGVSLAGFKGVMPNATYATNGIIVGTGGTALVTTPIPEPAIIAVFAIGLAAMGGLARRRQNKKA